MIVNKIKNNLVKGTIKQIKPFVYAIEVKDSYERAMLFCRYSEFYESPFKQIKNTFFTLEEYMNFYRKQKNRDVFTYPNDWAGYNISSVSLSDAITEFSRWNLNQYDVLMKNIFEECEQHSRNFNNGQPHKWYLIGIDKFKSKIMDHEMAHAFYNIYDEYRETSNDLVSNLKKRHFNQIKKCLLKIGYANDGYIINDEIQAYMSTGLLSSFDGDEIREYRKPFIKLFKTYKGK